MSQSAALSSGQDNIVHYTSVRMRIIGSGNLDMTMFSQDDVFSSVLSPFVMQSVTNIRPTRLMNFQHQRAYIKGSTNVISEWFSINKIVIYASGVFSEYPSVT